MQQLDVPIAVVVRSGAYDQGTKAERYIRALLSLRDEHRGWSFPASSASHEASGMQCAFEIDSVALGLSANPVTPGAAAPSDHERV